MALHGENLDLGLASSCSRAGWGMRGADGWLTFALPWSAHGPERGSRGAMSPESDVPATAVHPDGRASLFQANSNIRRASMYCAGRLLRGSAEK